MLATAAAGRAGWIDVADRCRQLVLEHNPAHLIGRFSTAADALRSPDFAPLVNQLERMCSYERAEFLLNELGLDAEGASPAGGEPNADAGDAEQQDAGQIALALLGRGTE